ncbi:terminase gpA endonuclease subunit [Gimesia fumaroli]|nr:terminase gpA endonuclease subunit [Gimesia fumaroli]
MPTDMKSAGERHRATAGKRSRERSEAAAEIGLPPAVVDPARKEACRFDLLLFLTTYFPHSTGLKPFSEDHKQAIESIQTAILSGGRYLNAVYRGFAKTTISENAALWATLYGHRRFVVIVGADETAASENIDSIKTELLTNELLYEDFPEACFPIVELDNKFQRCSTQTVGGELTHIKWNADKVVLPSVYVNDEISDSGGAIIQARGLTGRIRGLAHKRSDGVKQRPDLAIIDDPQTDVSAASPTQVNSRLKLIQKAVLKLAGHNSTLACVMNATVIEEGDLVDQLLDPIKHPEWQGVRVAMVKSWAKRHDDLWKDQYARLRNSYNPELPGDKKRAEAEATVFYQANFEAMNDGCEVSWSYCYDEENEISAIQHAYNALIDDGEDVFETEYQNNPQRAGSDSFQLLSVREIAEKCNEFGRFEVPPDCRKLVMSIDVQQKVLFYTILAVSDQFDIFELDSGCYPDQRKQFFSLKDIKPTIQQKHPGLGLEKQLEEALLTCVWLYHGQTYRNKAGEEFSMGTTLIDGAWGESNAAVKKVCRESEFAKKLYPAYGKGVKASDYPLLSIKPQKGEFRPSDTTVPWRMLPSEERGQRHVIWDTNSVKTFLHRRLLVPYGSPGSMTLWNKKGGHDLYAEHLRAEYAIEVEARGRKVNEWKINPGRPDNHWLDTTGMAIVAASIEGASLLGKPAARKSKRKRRKRVSYL